MKKIPTLFQRDSANLRQVTSEPHPDCLWVLAGEGIARRKYDGTCVSFDALRGQWWARREVKPGGDFPPGFRYVSHDDGTGKIVGWEPIGNSSFARFLPEAIATSPLTWMPGSYELCGPKINGNPDRFQHHTLIRHADAEVLDDAPRNHDDLRAYLTAATFTYEGIVWHHPDGRMAKIKKRDFPDASPR